ncbi:hypothetical protein BSKO_01195 [Bryopsis sp. KO-2023]|nr:hypothetical protein BSKO_01195 [Bryopsis sp. KO-2023]
MLQSGNLLGRLEIPSEVSFDELTCLIQEELGIDTSPKEEIWHEERKRVVKSQGIRLALRPVRLPRDMAGKEENEIPINSQQDTPRFVLRYAGYYGAYEVAAAQTQLGQGDIFSEEILAQQIRSVEMAFRWPPQESSGRIAEGECANEISVQLAAPKISYRCRFLGLDRIMFPFQRAQALTLFGGSQPKIRRSKRAHRRECSFQCSTSIRKGFFKAMTIARGFGLTRRLLRYDFKATTSCL